MHEFSLTQNIIEIAERYAKEALSGKNKNINVKKIGLVIGEASGIAGEAVKLYFDIIAKNTVCEGAAVEIETVKAVVKCSVCGKLFTRKPFSFQCGCGGDALPTEAGREFYVKYIEVQP